MAMVEQRDCRMVSRSIILSATCELTPVAVSRSVYAITVVAQTVAPKANAVPAGDQGTLVEAETSTESEPLANCQVSAQEASCSNQTPVEKYSPPDTPPMPELSVAGPPMAGQAQAQDHP